MVESELGMIPGMIGAMISILTIGRTHLGKNRIFHKIIKIWLGYL